MGLIDKQCIAELQYKANKFLETRYVEALDSVYKSDDIVPRSLKTALKNEVGRLEDVPEKDKDWHPGSNDQVLDIVHPSMYLLITVNQGFYPKTLAVWMTICDDAAKD